MIANQLSIILSAIARATDVDLTRLAWRPGVIAALPVAAMMALGTLLDQPVAAVTLGVGAMLVGVAWRAGDGPATPPLGTMALAAVMLALSTVVGTLTGRWPWLHLGVLFLFCLWAGLSSAIGRRGAVVGTQTLIAFIVFGRFPESLVGGLRLAGLVLGGAVVQLLFAGLVGAPLAWRRQRRLLAEAYRQLAALAGTVTVSGVGAAEAFDAAELALGVPALFGDPDRSGLVSLVSEGRRIRLELLVLRATITSLRSGRAPELAESLIAEVEGTLTLLRDALGLIVASLEQPDPTGLEATAAQLGHWSETREAFSSPLLEARVAALGGQVRAAVRQASAVAAHGSDRTWRLPHPNLGSRSSLTGAGTDLQRIRDSLSLASPAGRHAVRLAVVVAGTELLSQRAGLPRGYWAVVAAATVLRPNFGDTFTRGAERVIGTLSGAVIATLIAVAVDPSGWGIVLTIGLLAFLTYTVFGASFAAGVSGLTAMIVFLLHGVAPDSVTIAIDRGLDTIIGGAVGLLATMLWPTWSSDALPRSLGVLIAAQRVYLHGVLTALAAGGPPELARVRPLARHVRVAYADAETTVSLARSEPARGAPRHITPDHAAAALAALRRVTYAIHALRLAAPDGCPGRVETGIGALDRALEDALTAIAGALAGPDGSGPSGDGGEVLRARYRAVASDLDRGVSQALDELVDAVNSVAAALRTTSAPEPAAATAQLSSASPV